ncbi:hypothetical protein [Kitasatospora sp. NPDC002040]|uniref:hypothetical protein n=1 Tax=Kitasatospora sp. NPDC002040 TaxID=3154661 RepID=UPI0033200002
MTTSTRYLAHRNANSRWARAGSYGAAGWGLAFALVHLYWLLGGRTGLPAGLSLRDNLPLLVIDVAALALGTRTAGGLTGLERFATFLYEPWFLTGGVLFGLATLGTRVPRPVVAPR